MGLNFKSLVGQQFGTMVAVDMVMGKPARYVCRCVECGSTGQVALHTQLLNGAVRCSASIHGKRSEDTRRQNVSIAPGGRVRDAIDRSNDPDFQEFVHGAKAEQQPQSAPSSPSVWELQHRRNQREMEEWLAKRYQS